MQRYQENNLEMSKEGKYEGKVEGHGSQIKKKKAGTHLLGIPVVENRGNQLRHCDSRVNNE